jgi:anion-transporting  ArsA/GET3 family ATPase
LLSQPLLLLDATQSYHRDIARGLSEVPDAVAQLLPRLRDPDYTRVLIVTLPEATPVHKAARLSEDLQRAGIAPYAWIVNQSLARPAPSTQRSPPAPATSNPMLPRPPPTPIAWWSSPGSPTCPPATKDYKP